VNVNDVEEITAKDATECVASAAMHFAQENSLYGLGGIQRNKLWGWTPSGMHNLGNLPSLENKWWSTTKWSDLRGSVVITSKNGHFKSRNMKFTWQETSHPMAPQRESLKLEQGQICGCRSLCNGAQVNARMALECVDRCSR